MKKMILATLLLTLFVGTSFAQQMQGRQGQDFQQRRQQQMEELKKEIGLNKDQVKKFDEIYKKYDDKMAAMREDMMAGGDREAMRSKMQQINTERDAEVKKMLNKDQVKKFDDYQKKLAEQRAQRQGGRGGDR